MRALLTIVVLTGSIQAFPVPKAARVADLTDSTWFGDGIVAPTRYTFGPGGVLTYSYNNNTYSNGRWTQDGAKIYWERNNKYCEFEGTLEGDEIRGKAWNVNHLRMDLSFRKIKADNLAP